MTRQYRTRTVLFSAGLALILGGVLPAQAANSAKSMASSSTSAGTSVTEEWPIPTGEHWLKATETEKQAYVLGILNMAMIEYQLTGQKPKHRTVVPRLLQGLDGMTVLQITETVNTYYKANPDKQQDPIIEVIWSQIVKPKLDQSKAK
ncbi:MAG: hypothetical protein IAF00_00575 [Phycisphaerales bacterium]|nr:hypothetical protein [Phycisphaerales bacterium]